ncbi:MAG: Lrp/AsnC family transcriptional regulator [Nitrososphaerales archaeon]
MQAMIGKEKELGRIDEIDMKILEELIKDASLSVPRMSKKIKVNSSVLYSRIKRLSRRNLIKRFTVEVNEELLGFNVAALVGANLDARIREKTIEDLMQFDDVRDIFEVTGRYDVVMHIKAKSLDELHGTVTDKIGQVEGVLRTETFVEMRRRRRQSAYKLPQA